MPTSVSPSTGAPERTFAKDQPQFRPIEVACYEAQQPPEYLMRYQLSDAERAQIAAGADIYLSMQGCVAPHRLEVGAQEWMTPRVLPPSNDDSLGEPTLLVVGGRVLKLRAAENLLLWTLTRDDVPGKLEVQFTGALGVPERFVGAILEAGAFQAQTCGRVFTFTGCGLVSAEHRTQYHVPETMQISYTKLDRTDL